MTVAPESGRPPPIPHRRCPSSITAPDRSARHLYRPRATSPDLPLLVEQVLQHLVRLQLYRVGLVHPHHNSLWRCHPVTKRDLERWGMLPLAFSEGD